MESRIPVPTDNIYKFYALFSLLLFVFSVGAVLYMGSATSNIILDNVVEVETLKAEKSPTISQLTKRRALEQKMEIAVADKHFFFRVLGVIAGFGVVGMYYGFKKWHTEVQPVLDESALIQLEIAKLQLLKLKRECGLET